MYSFFPPYTFSDLCSLTRWFWNIPQVQFSLKIFHFCLLSLEDSYNYMRLVNNTEGVSMMSLECKVSTYIIYIVCTVSSCSTPDGHPCYANIASVRPVTSRPLVYTETSIGFSWIL